MTTPLAMVVDAVASRIDTGGLGDWNPHGTYPASPSLPPIYGKRFGTKAPDKAIAITAYSIEVSPDPREKVQKFRVQVRCRAKENADLVADPILTLLHGAVRQRWGALTIQACQHLSTAQLGANSQDFDERTDNYELEILNE